MSLLNVPLPLRTSASSCCPSAAIPFSRLYSSSPPPVPGQKFIPHRQFRSGVFLPDVLLANPRLSCGAKLLWARLARYAGVNGVCFPSCQTLGTDLGCSARQID